MPNSTTISETVPAAAGSEGLIVHSAQNSVSDWLEGCPAPKKDQDQDDKGAQDAITETKEPLIPRIFPVYAFI